MAPTVVRVDQAGLVAAAAADSDSWFGEICNSTAGFPHAARTVLQEPRGPLETQAKRVSPARQVKLLALTPMAVMGETGVQVEMAEKAAMAAGEAVELAGQSNSPRTESFGVELWMLAGDQDRWGLLQRVFIATGPTSMAHTTTRLLRPHPGRTLMFHTRLASRLLEFLCRTLPSSIAFLSSW